MKKITRRIEVLKSIGAPSSIMYDVLTVGEIQDYVFDMSSEEKKKFFEQLRLEGWEKQPIGLCYDDVLFRRPNYFEAQE